jgi:hypothetical protein
VLKYLQYSLLCAAVVLAMAVPAGAQSLTQTQAKAESQAQPAAAATSGSDGGWQVALYPVLVWVPLGIEIDVTVPPNDGGGGGGGGESVDGRFDGAFLGGFSVSKGLWRVDADGLWAAVGGDRPDNPKLTVDTDII